MELEGMKIDVHHHILPENYISKLKEIGITEAIGVSFPEWNPERSLKFMKKVGIDTAITSISSPGVCFKDDDFSRGLARLCNNEMAELKRKYPGKFGGFASVPLPNIDSALDEIRYALDDLRLDGVCLMTHYEGKYLGCREFNEMFDELNTRKAIVYIHPTDPTSTYDSGLNISNALIEAPFETTRAVTNLIYSGTTDRCPNIRYILSHGGGTVPYLAWRIALIKYGQENKKPPLLRSLYDFIIKGGPESGLKILRSMYYDTALTSSPYALRALHEFVGPTKIVFGSDFPFAKMASIVAKNLEKFEGFSKEDLNSVYHLNCLELFAYLENTKK
jgi:predicted TIM-barrel fold metal-dependent hydrolase